MWLVIEVQREPINGIKQGMRSARREGQSLEGGTEGGGRTAGGFLKSIQVVAAGCVGVRACVCAVVICPWLEKNERGACVSVCVCGCGKRDQGQKPEVSRSLDAQIQRRGERAQGERREGRRYCLWSVGGVFCCSCREASLEPRGPDKEAPPIGTSSHCSHYCGPCGGDGVGDGDGDGERKGCDGDGDSGMCVQLIAVVPSPRRPACLVVCLISLKNPRRLLISPAFPSSPSSPSSFTNARFSHRSAHYVFFHPFLFPWSTIHCGGLYPQGPMIRKQSNAPNASFTRSRGMASATITS